VAALARKSKLYDVRTGVDTSFSDLRSNPVLFIGFSNRLHLEMTRGLRFTFALENNVKTIRDHVLPERSFRLPSIAPDGKTDSDFGLISRVFDSESGQLLIQVAGITNYGTRAAGEFLSNPARVQQISSLLPPDWAKKNLQIVLTSRVIGQSPTPAKVVAVHTW
jgi:hypothetical protein